MHKTLKTDRDAVWVVNSYGLNEPCIRWGPEPHGKGQFEGEEVRSIVKCRDGDAACLSNYFDHLFIFIYTARMSA